MKTEKLETLKSEYSDDEDYPGAVNNFKSSQEIQCDGFSSKFSVAHATDKMQAQILNNTEPYKNWAQVTQQSFHNIIE